MVFMNANCLGGRAAGTVLQSFVLGLLRSTLLPWVQQRQNGGSMVAVWYRLRGELSGAVPGLLGSTAAPYLSIAKYLHYFSSQKSVIEIFLHFWNKFI